MVAISLVLGFVLWRRRADRSDWAVLVAGAFVGLLPMWFHRLDQLEKNIVTDDQAELGWNDYERRKIMQWFYKHKKAVL